MKNHIYLFAVSLSLICSSVVSAEESDTATLFHTIGLTIGVDGQCQLTIDNRKDDTSRPKGDGKKVELAAFKNADVRRLKDGRLRILHDFSKFHDVDALKASFLPHEAKNVFEELINIDEDDGLLVLIPDKKKRVHFIYPRHLTAPINTTVETAAFKEGLVQIELTTIRRRLLVLLNGENSPSGQEGTVSVIWVENANKKTIKHPLLKFKAPKSDVIKQEFKLPTEFDLSGQRFLFQLTLGSEVPAAFKSIQMTASVPPSFGVALGARGMRVIANRVIEGSAGAKAKIKRGDILVSVNGTEVKSLQGAMKALSESGLGNKSTWVVERFGKKRTIIVTPN